MRGGGCKTTILSGEEHMHHLSKLSKNLWLNAHPIVRPFLVLKSHAVLKVFVDISDESFRAKLDLKTKELTKNSHSLLQVSLAKFLSDYLFFFQFFSKLWGRWRVSNELYDGTVYKIDSTKRVESLRTTSSPLKILKELPSSRPFKKLSFLMN